jgi:hypothetical protein
MRTIQKLMGHRHIGTTALYCDVSEDTLRNAVEVFGGKATCHFALQMFAYDPKRTCMGLVRPLPDYTQKLLRSRV